jgi:Lar family restriction alleviation protein
LPQRRESLILMRENMQTENELAKCPFCGNEDCAVDYNSLHYFVTCSKCNAQGPCGDIEEEAIAAWNRRKGEA